MRKVKQSAVSSLGRVHSATGVGVDARMSEMKRLSREQLDDIYRTVGSRLREGRSREAEELLVQTLESHSLAADDFANLKRLLAFTLETLGRYKESLEVLKPFEGEEFLEPLAIDTQVRVTTQLAIAYNNVNDHPKAVTLLKKLCKKPKRTNYAI